MSVREEAWQNTLWMMTATASLAFAAKRLISMLCAVSHGQQAQKKPLSTGLYFAENRSKQHLPFIDTGCPFV